MTKRRLISAGTAVCLVAVGVVGWYANRPHPISQANFEKINLGMSRAEVEAILGGPPGRMIPIREPAPDRPDAYCCWDGPELREIRVAFGRDGKVIDRGILITTFDPPPGFLSRLRARLGW